jgi:hypothetical protein
VMRRNEWSVLFSYLKGTSFDVLPQERPPWANVVANY